MLMSSEKLRNAGWCPGQRPGEWSDPKAPVAFPAATAVQVQTVRDGIAILERAGWTVGVVGVPGVPPKQAPVAVSVAVDPSPPPGRSRIVPSLGAALARQSAREQGIERR